MKMDLSDRKSVEEFGCDLKKLVLLEIQDIDIEDFSAKLRSLRNKCAIKTFQTAVGAHPTLVSDIVKIMYRLINLSTQNSHHIICLRLSAQFLGNLTVNNLDNQELVWSHFELLQKLSLNKDIKTRNYIAMCLNNIILGLSCKCPELLNNKEMVEQIISDAKDGNEFSSFIVESLLKNGFFKDLYYLLPSEEHLFLLETVDVALSEKKNILLIEDLKLISEKFKIQSDCILKTVATYVNSIEPWEVTKLATILGCLSSLEMFNFELQKDKSLFINCAFLLRSIHSVGKESGNLFSMISKLEKATEEMKSHPAFGFKAALIRIMGNMCYRNKDIQDLMRELECIPLILECCNIDARNPFITQWAILAIKNLCENNLENQKIIAGLDKKEFVNSSIIQEMGITLHADEGSAISIVPEHKR